MFSSVIPIGAREMIFLSVLGFALKQIQGSSLYCKAFAHPLCTVSLFPERGYLEQEHRRVN